MIRDLTWRPAGRVRPVLEGLDLTIEPGQKVLLVGPSGSGKSTLLRAIAGLLRTADVGDQSGRVTVDGELPQQTPGQVGLLLQDPGAGLVADVVGRDVSFGLENTRVPAALMPALVRQALDAAHFPYDERRRTDSLSGGETQRLALAGSMALTPRVLLLDEPTSMLDDDNAAWVRRSVLDSVEASGATLVVVEHRLGPWVSQMDRCVVLDAQGRVFADGTPAAVLGGDWAALAAAGVWVPGAPDPMPLHVDQALVTPHASLPVGEPVVTASDVCVVHRSPFDASGRRAAGTVAVESVSCALGSGQVLGLRGVSGAGKSSLLAVLAGLQPVAAGACKIHAAWSGRKGPSLAALSSLELARRLAWVPQLPEHGLVASSVIDELMVSARALGLPEAGSRERALGLLEVLGIGHLAQTNAYRLSGGEQRRLVTAAALVHGPSGLLLDEPTVGQDRLTWAAVTGVCQAARDAGVAVAVATHDGLALDSLTGPGQGRVLELEDGRAVGNSS